jgi:hypothetical protein
VLVMVCWALCTYTYTHCIEFVGADGLFTLTIDEEDNGCSYVVVVN